MHNPAPITAGQALISPDENRRMFDTISRRYDLLNSIISLGQDRVWRRKAVDHLLVKRGGQYADAGCGTGALTLEIASRFPWGDVAVTGVDFSEAMLHEGEKRLQRLGVAVQLQEDGGSRGRSPSSNSHYAASNTAGGDGEPPSSQRTTVIAISGGRASSRAVTLLHGDALKLPFKDASVDGVISGFVLRNINDRPAALAEWFRVLRPGGRCVVLELAVPEKPFARGLYRMFTRLVVPMAAFLLSRHKAYVYLLDSIQAFPPSETVCALFRQSKFADVQTLPLTFGAVRIYCGTKA